MEPLGTRVQQRLPRQSHLFFLAILVLALFLIWIVFKPFMIFMITGVFVAVLALPIDKFWERLLPNRVAAVFTMTSLAVILLIPLVGLGFALANDATDLAEAIAEGKLEDMADEALGNPLVQRGLELAYPNNSTEERNATVREQVDRIETRAIEELKQFGTDLLKAIPDFLVGVTVVLFVVYYVLTDGERLVDYLRRAAPLPSRQVDFLLHEARNGLRAVFVGQILTSTIQGALGGIGFLITGLPGAIVWAAVMAVLSLLPVVGAFLVWVPAAVFLLVNGAIWQGVFLIIWGAIVVSQVDNFIRPRLIGNRADIHPIFVLVGVLGGVAAFGFVGLFLGPLIVGVTISVLKVWESDYLHPDVGRKDPTAQPRALEEEGNKASEGGPDDPPGAPADEEE